jgi:hypothetical protein
MNTQQAIREYKAAIDAAVVIPNSWLTTNLQDNVRGGRTINKINKLLDERDGITEHRKLKAVKARNIARLAAQFEAGREEFDYSQNERNELQLHRNECAMVDAMIAAGHIDRDDLEVE